MTWYKAEARAAERSVYSVTEDILKSSGFCQFLFSIGLKSSYKWEPIYIKHFSNTSETGTKGHRSG